MTAFDDRLRGRHGTQDKLTIDQHRRATTRGADEQEN